MKLQLKLLIGIFIIICIFSVSQYSSYSQTSEQQEEREKKIELLSHKVEKSGNYTGKFIG